MSHVNLEIRELPLRPKKLTEDELGKVFGGAKGLGGKCEFNKDCSTGKCQQTHAVKVVAFNNPAMNQLFGGKVFVEGGISPKISAQKVCT